MSNNPISQVTSSAMSYERSRVELAMLRLSLVDVSFSSANEAKTFAAHLQSGLDSQLLNTEGLEKIGVKTILDPDNPNADAEGNVYFVQIDPTKEMATLMSATRAYEANAKAYNVNAQMTRAALEMGSR